MLDTNILYDDKNDNLYILIYKLGKGAYSVVWYSIEIPNFFSCIKNKKNLILNQRALKVHLDDSYDVGLLESKINNILIYNKKRSKYINYPLSSFVHDEIYFIIVYELAVGSLYDVLKKCDRKLDLSFINKIIPQMIKSIQFIHNCDYIHTDIKPENFLLMGTNKEQNNIYNFIKSYNLTDRLKKVSNFKKSKSNALDKSVNEPIYKLLQVVSKKFSLKNNILSNDDSNNYSDNSEEDNEDDEDDEDDDDIKEESNKSIISIYSNISDISNESDYNTDKSSYNSNIKINEYYFNNDIFHTKDILKYINIQNNKKIKLQNKLNNKNIKNNIKIDSDLELLLKNPEIKLTDFGLIEKKTSKKHTIQTRYYRSPEIILGLDYKESCDFWSLGCSIYELLIGKIFIDIDNDNDINRYDKDLINLKILIEKLGYNKHKEIIKMIQISNRKNKILHNNGYLKFYKNINYNLWIDDIYKIYDKDNIIVNEIIILINSMLEIDPLNRSINYNK